MTARAKPRRGRWLVVATAVVVGGLSAAVLAIEGTGDRGLGLALRATARTSLALFLLTFTASSVNALWRSRAGKWLLRNRRYLGVSFAVSHFIHLGLIGARARLEPDAFWANRDVASMIPGMTAYAFITLMTITSLDGPTRWLGRAKWKILHKVGIYVIWAVFVGAYAGRLDNNPYDVIPIALLLAAFGLRVIARTRRRGR